MMETRFDEVELLHIEAAEEAALAKPLVHPRRRSVEKASPSPSTAVAVSRWRRGVAFLIDGSLFVALAVALSPLVPRREDPQLIFENDIPLLAGLTGFLLLFSYYYFCGAWLIWGKTVGGAITEVKVIASDGSPLGARSATRRWVFTLASILMAGLGFLLALLPSRLSLADRASSSRCIRS